MKKAIISAKGFTLIELLIVVAIIGILAAIAIPAFLGQQKKARTKALESTCSGAAKSAGTLLKSLGDQDPIVFQQTPALKICFAHIARTMVDSDADGVAEMPACQARYNEAYVQGGNAQGTYGLAGVEAQEIAEAMVHEACGPTLMAGPLTIGSYGANPIGVTGGLGQNRTSPYYNTKCAYDVEASTTFAIVDDAAGNEGQCILEYNNAARAIRVVMVDDNGNTGSHGETRVYPAITGD